MILLVVSLKYNVDSSLVFWIIYNQNKCAFFLGLFNQNQTTNNISNAWIWIGVWYKCNRYKM